MVLAIFTQLLIAFAILVAVVTVCYALGWGSWARYRKNTLLLLAVAALVFTPAVAARLGAQNAAPGFPDLVAALKATPGCLGVEAARTMSGKQVIFAWFDNKQSVLSWYYSEVHQDVMRQFVPDRPVRTPLADLPDDGQPILAIASLTMADKPMSDVIKLPVSQISIELYRPAPGGLSVGGRFAPATLKVPGLRDIPWSSLGAGGR